MNARSLQKQINVLESRLRAKQLTPTEKREIRARFESKTYTEKTTIPVGAQEANKIFDDRRYFERKRAQEPKPRDVIWQGQEARSFLPKRKTAKKEKAKTEQQILAERIAELEALLG